MLQSRMPRWFKRLRSYFEYRYFRYIARTFSLGPPLLGTLFLLVLWLPDQMGVIEGDIVGRPRRRRPFPRRSLKPEWLDQCFCHQRLAALALVEENIGG